MKQFSLSTAYDRRMNKTLIRGATVLTLDPRLGDFAKGDILIDGAAIAAVAPSLAVEDAEIVPAEGMIALPGFVDSHRHTWQSLLRATAVDWTLAQYFAGIRGVMGRLYTPDDMYVANLLGALEALDAGITTLYDWSHNNNTPDHADEAVRGLSDAGIRGVYGYGNANDEWIPPSRLPTNFADIERVRRTHFAASDRLLTMAFAARGPQFTTLDITADEFRRARDLDLRITVHVGDGVWGTNRPVMQLAERGLLGDDVTYVHCNTLADEEFRLIGESGGTASISPEVELQMGHGWLATMKLLAAGVRPSLSIDIVTSIAGDMFGAMRTLLLGTRAVVNGEALARAPDRRPAAAHHARRPRIRHAARRPRRRARRNHRLAHPGQGRRHRACRHQQPQLDPDEQRLWRDRRIRPRRQRRQRLRQRPRQETPRPPARRGRAAVA